MKAVLLFIVGLVLLIFCGDWFVDGAVGLARRFKIPEILLGATIVSIGTTLPEVMVSATSSVQGYGSLAYGNAIGSVICNTSLIAALTIAIKPSDADRKALITPVLFFFGSSAAYAACAYFFGGFARWAGIVFLAIFVIYMIMTVKQAVSDSKRNLMSAGTGEGNIENEQEKEPLMPLWKTLLFLVLGAAGIAVGARLLVNNGVILAKQFGVPETVIGLTFVALGTSLPELVTAVTALVKGHSSLSLGNIVGANLFNIILVSGLSVALSPFQLPASKELCGINSSLLIDLPLMFAVMAIMTVPTLIRGKLARWQGIVLLVLYAGFCYYQFVV